MSDGAHPHEIIIIKRHGGGHEDGHHGGAWKIAYADFVTAMMAFFLVMWLISANDKTKAVIARYFNPVQLVDSTPQPPGLNDAKDKAPNVTTKTNAKAPPDSKDPAPTKEPAASKEPSAKDAKPAPGSEKSEAELFKDPAAALTAIAAKDQPRTAPKGSASGAQAGAATGTAGQRGGEAFRDPFEPMPTTGTPPPTDAGAAAGRAEIDPPPPNAAPVAKSVPDPASATAPEAPLPAEPQARAAELRNRIDALVHAVAAATPASVPKVEVKATSEGVLIALTDDARFSMFASASAEPAARTVVLMEKIGRLLKAQKGKVVIRGFTDSRKYRSDTYDNWRLSSARAHMAHYMLARGGLEDARVDRIEGYADRQPRNAKDPESPDNRRIEILLEPSP